uniref:Major capsid protein n=1 Tax=viral metagenome TaxID=1070528 RepID=A0A6C0H151_9ZZZZ
MESIEQTFNGTGDFGRKVQCPVVRNGDLITKMYLRVAISAGDSTAVTTGNWNNVQWAWVTSLGHALIDNVELEIGGTRIDKHWGDWLTIWNELSRKIGQDRGYNTMIGNVPALTTLAQAHPAYVLWVPLRFFFCRFDGLALPLIALQYHEVRVNFEFVAVENLINFQQIGTGGAKALANALGLAMTSCSLYVDYIYLDSEERKRFAQASHEYLIEALQYPGAESVVGLASKIRLNLNHPCKFLIWTTKLGRYSNGSSFIGNAGRFALAFAASGSAPTNANSNIYTGEEGQVAFVTVDSNGVIVPRSASLQAIYNYMQPVLIATENGVGVAEVNNVTLLGVALSEVFLSTPTSQYTSSTVVTFADGHTITADLSTRNSDTGNEGASKFDIFIQQYDNFGNQLDGSENPVLQALLQLNGQDRFDQREGQYFNYVQPWQCFSNTPSDGINVYSFALNPEEHQPSGTCNFSRIDNATLSINFGRLRADGDAESYYQSNYIGSNGTATSVWAVNYNVLRVMSGMAGLAYSN